MYEARQLKHFINRQIGQDSKKSKKLSQTRISTAMIQRYEMGPNKKRTVNIYGKDGTIKSFEECLENKVSYKKGDDRRRGTETGTAAWKDWIKDLGTGNNATQIHVVNKKWGGLGGQNDGNIVPGSQKLNSNHLNEAENKFEQICFESQNTAICNCEYLCKVEPNYGDSIDLNCGEPKKYEDPQMTVTITKERKSDDPISISKGKGLEISTPTK